MNNKTDATPALCCSAWLGSVFLVFGRERYGDWKHIIERAYLTRDAATKRANRLQAKDDGFMDYFVQELKIQPVPNK